jgi:large conductance mechanosensitive channel
MSKKLIQDFKAFAFKGNVLDLAIGVIIGGAFGKIVSSLVNDIIMPPFGFVLKGINLKSFAWVLQRNADGTPALSMTYGNFLQNLIEFLIVGFSIFLVVRAISQVEKRFRRQEEQQAAAPATPPEDVALLREIRDLLKKGK